MIRLIVFATLLLALPASAQERIWRVGLLTNSTQTSASGVQTWRDEILRVLSENGFDLKKTLELVERHSDGNFDRLPRLADEMSRARLDVVVAISDVSVRAALAAIAVTPVVMVVGEDPIANGFVSGYGHDLSYSHRRVGEYAVRILRGTKPSELPVEAPDQWKLVVNLKAAQALGIAIPGLIMARANEVIE